MSELDLRPVDDFDGLPETMTFVLDAGSHAVLAMVWLFGIGVGVVLFEATETVAVATIALFSVLAAMKIVNLMPGALTLTLTRDGFVLRKLFIGRKVQWRDIVEPFDRDIVVQQGIGYLYPEKARRNRLYHWLNRLMLGVDGWIVVWNFRAPPRVLLNQMRRCWRRARPELRDANWLPPSLTLEGGTFMSIPAFVVCWCGLVWSLSWILTEDWLNITAWLLAGACGWLAVSVLLNNLPGMKVLKLDREGFVIVDSPRNWRVRWAEIDRPYMARIYSRRYPSTKPSLWAWDTFQGVLCRFRPDASPPEKLRRLETGEIQIAQHGLQQAQVLRFMTGYWDLNQHGLAKLDPPAAKE